MSKVSLQDRAELRALYEKSEVIGPSGECYLGAKYHFSIRTTQIAMDLLDDLEATEAKLKICETKRLAHHLRIRSRNCSKEK